MENSTTTPSINFSEIFHWHSCCGAALAVWMWVEIMLRGLFVLACFHPPVESLVLSFFAVCAETGERSAVERVMRQKSIADCASWNSHSARKCGMLLFNIHQSCMQLVRCVMPEIMRLHVYEFLIKCTHHNVARLLAFVVLILKEQFK